MRLKERVFDRTKIHENAEICFLEETGFIGLLDDVMGTLSEDGPLLPRLIDKIIHFIGRNKHLQMEF